MADGGDDRTTVAAAAAAWGRLTADPVPVSAGTWRVAYDDGRTCALHLHPPGSAAAVAEAMALMELLADAAFACPWPQRSAAGGLVVEGTGGVASAVQWIEGGTVAAETRPAAQLVRYRALGELIADLHATADAVAPALHQRPRLDAVALAGPADPPPAWPADLADLWHAVRARAAETLGRLPDADGVVHGDPGPARAILGADTMYLVGFGACGTGLRIIDLARALLPHAGRPAYRGLRVALLAGYREGGGPASDEALAAIDLAVTGAAMAGARHGAEAADRAAHLAGSWIADGAL